MAKLKKAEKETASRDKKDMAKKVCIATSTCII